LEIQQPKPMTLMVSPSNDRNSFMRTSALCSFNQCARIEGDHEVKSDKPAKNKKKKKISDDEK
jgi:hypothetical protein